MKKLLALVMILTVSLTQAQEKEVKYEAAGDMVKATYYFANGKIMKQGFFKNKKLAGKWTQYDKSGNQVAVGHYDNGVKVGTWFYWGSDNLRQVNYQNNVIASVSMWKQDSKLAINNE